MNSTITVAYRIGAGVSMADVVMFRLRKGALIKIEDSSIGSSRPDGRYIVALSRKNAV